MKTTKEGIRDWERSAMILLLLAATALRLVALSKVPPGLRYDELLNYQMAQRVLAGQRPVYFGESWGHEPLFHYTQAIAIALTRHSDWILRLPAALFGLLGMLTTWLVARRLFGARVAVLSSAALTISFWSVFYSRQGLRVIAAVPLSCLMVYSLWRALERRSERRWRTMGYFALAGAFLGSALYTYMAARAMPLLIFAFGLYLALFHRSHFKRAWPGLLLLLFIAGSVSIPLLVQLRRAPELEQRVAQLTAPWDALKEGRPGPMLDMTVRALGMFLWRGQSDWLYNVSGRPVFDPLTAICFALGIACCAWRWHQARCGLLLLWLAVGLAPAVVALPAASLSHAIVAQPAAYILMALGLDALWQTVKKRRAWMGPLLAAGIVAFHGALSGYAYFVVWPNAPEVRELYQAGVTAVARALDANSPSGPVAIGAPYVDYWHPWNAVAFDLSLRREDLHVRWFNPGGAWVWPTGAEPSTFYFPTDPLGPQSIDPGLETLFAADAVPLDTPTDDFTVFRVAQLQSLEERLEEVTDTSATWPPDLAHLPPPTLPLIFDDRFALMGADLQKTPVAPGGDLRWVTYWEVLAADPTPVVAFAHLTADGQDIWGQHDGLDVRPASLWPGDRFAQVHRVSVKPETPPGIYHLQVGLYHPETLTRLPITAGKSLADRVWVGRVEVRE